MIPSSKWFRFFGGTTSEMCQRFLFHSFTVSWLNPTHSYRSRCLDYCQRLSFVYEKILTYLQILHPTNNIQGRFIQYPTTS